MTPDAGIVPALEGKEAKMGCDTPDGEFRMVGTAGGAAPEVKEGFKILTGEGTKPDAGIVPVLEGKVAKMGCDTPDGEFRMVGTACGAAPEVKVGFLIRTGERIETVLLLLSAEV